MEVTGISKANLERGDLKVVQLGRGLDWLEAGHFVETIETRQGYKVACLEEIAFHNGWPSAEQLAAAAERLIKNSYGLCMMTMLKGKR